jgi:hypothetical protein
MIDRRRARVVRTTFALVFAYALCVGAVSSATAASPANVDIFHEEGNQQETTVAVNPSNPQQVFVASNDEHLPAGLFSGRSSDGGITWIHRSVATGSDGLPPACCDGSASWDAFGNLFLTYLTFVPAGDGKFLFDIVVALSTNGGASFSLLAQLSNSHDTDQPTVTTGAGSVWVTYRDFGADFGPNGTLVARGARVSGRGAVGAFIGVQRVPGTETDGSFGDIAIGPTGQVVVTYQSPADGEGPATIYTNLDQDGLGPRSFGRQRIATSTNVGGFDFITPQPFRSVDAEAGLAFDRSAENGTNAGAHRGTLYLVYTDELPNESNNTDILLRRSTNNGATWSAPVRVNDDTGTTSQFNPHLALDQQTGTLAVSWHDARNDPVNDRSVQYWGAFSTNGGLSFWPNIKISAGSSNVAPRAPNGHFVQISGIDYGDYTGNDFAGNVLHPAWADNSNSTGDNPPVLVQAFDPISNESVTVRTSLLDIYAAAVAGPH